MVDNTNLLKDGQSYYFNKVNMVIKIDKELYKVELGNIRIPIDLTGDIVKYGIIDGIPMIYRFPIIGFDSISSIKVLERIENASDD